MQSSSFYSTAAQVLPVLFLAIVFEQRVWDRAKPDHLFGIDIATPIMDRWMASGCGLLILMVPVNFALGEWLALRAIQHVPGAATRWFVDGTLVLGGLVVMLPMVQTGLLTLLPNYEDYKAARVMLAMLGVAATAFTVAGLLIAAF